VDKVLINHQPKRAPQPPAANGGTSLPA